MPLSWNEIRSNAIAFARSWAEETREEAEAKTGLIGSSSRPHFWFIPVPETVRLKNGEFRGILRENRQESEPESGTVPNQLFRQKANFRSAQVKTYWKESFIFFGNLTNGRITLAITA